MIEKNKEPTTKYDLNTGKTIKKVKKFGYKYNGKGEIGELKSEIIDGKRNYYVQYNLGRSSFSKNKSKFKKIEYWEEDIGWDREWVEKKEKKNKLVFDTKIDKSKGDFMKHIEIRLGKEDYLSFFRVEDSNIIRDLQLKKGDDLKVTIEVVKRI